MNMLMLQEVSPGKLKLSYTAISKEVVGKIARDNPEKYFGWFWVHLSSKKCKRIAREATDLNLRVLKESNKSSFDSYSVRNSVLPFEIVACTRFPTFLEIAVYARYWPGVRSKWLDFVLLLADLSLSHCLHFCSLTNELNHRRRSRYQLGSKIKRAG